MIKGKISVNYESKRDFNKYVCWRSHIISKNLFFFKWLNILNEPYFTHLFLTIDPKRKINYQKC